MALLLEVNTEKKVAEISFGPSNVPQKGDEVQIDSGEVYLITAKRIVFDNGAATKMIYYGEKRI